MPLLQRLQLHGERSIVQPRLLLPVEYLLGNFEMLWYWPATMISAELVPRTRWSPSASVGPPRYTVDSYRIARFEIMVRPAIGSRKATSHILQGRPLTRHVPSLWYAIATVVKHL